MSIKLDTGLLHAPNVTAHPDTVALRAFKPEEYDDTTPAEMVVFPREHRQLLLVEPKKMLVVTGYNLDHKSRVLFRKVLRSNGVPARGSNGCCPTITLSRSIRLYSVDLPCWTLDRCNPVFIVKTPGSYEIDVVGNSADVVVTAMLFDLQDVNDLPLCQCDQPQEPTPTEPVKPPNYEEIDCTMMDCDELNHTV